MADQLGGNGNYKVEKQFLSDDYTIRNSSGEKVGTAEKDLFSNNYTIKDNSGKKITGVGVPLPTGEIGTGGFIALLVVGIFIFISIDNIPIHLKSAFTSIDTEFYFITASLIAQIIIAVICFFLGQFRQTYHSYFGSLLYVSIIGLGSYIVVPTVIMAVAAIVEKASFLEWLVVSVGGILMYSASFLVALFPVVVIQAALIKQFGFRIKP